MAEPDVWSLLGKQIDDGFERQERQMQAMLAKQDLTNGRIREAELKLAVHTTLINANSERTELVAKRSHDTANIIQTVSGRLENFIAGGVTTSMWKWATREVTLVLGVVGITVGVLKFLKVLP